MTVVYPVVFTPLEEGGYLAYVPDLKSTPTAKTWPRPFSWPGTRSG